MEEDIRQSARAVKDAAGRPVMVLKDKEARSIETRLNRSMHEIYRAALSLGICPMRYLRNLESITIADQYTLSGKTAAVVGAGGLGGHVITLMARIGIGSVIVIDPDAFDETNLNRQALSGSRFVGVPKVRAAAEAVADINPGVKTICHQARFKFPETVDLLRGAHLIVDALDNIPDRISLQNAAAQLEVPFIHGAIAGFEGQVMTVLPGDAGLRRIYGDCEERGEKTARPEALLGTPALAPALIASMEVMEALKVLLGRNGLCRNSLLYVDMESGRMDRFSLGAGI